MKQYLIFPILLFCFALSAQTPQEVLQRIAAANQLKADFNLNMTLSYFGDANQKPEQVVDAVSQQSGSKQYFKIGYIEQVSDKQYVITINHEEKYVIADKKERYEAYKMPSDLNSFLTKMEQQEGELVTENITEADNVLKVLNKDSRDPSYAVYYDPGTFSVSKVIDYYNEDETAALYGEEFTTSRLEISVAANPPADPALQIAQVLEVSGKTLQLKPKYQGYTFYNLTIQQ